MKPQVKVEGLDLVQANLSRVTRGLAREQKNIHGTLGESIIDRARGRARVRTGRMRSMIRLRTTSERVEVTSEAEYARFSHYGTRYMSADLHLTEPLRELEDVLVRDYERLLDRYIDRNWRSNT
jgi:hypothetical protein